MAYSNTKPCLILQLHIELKHSPVPVWRRVHVPETITLVQLHKVIQVAMGWYDCHLHQFDINQQSYATVDPEWDLDELGLLPEARKRLMGLLAGRKKFRYIYDFGDCWEHSIKLESKLIPNSMKKSAFCVAAQGACPPEDVGSTQGYQEFIEVMANPNHEDYEDTAQWWGHAQFDPDAVCLQDINLELGRIIL